MPGLFELLVAYGAAFGAMNKMPDLVYEKAPALMNRLLACGYCTGFHTGWATYLAFNHADVTLHHMPLWAFASAAFSYGADTALRLAESHTHTLGEDQ